MKYKSIMFLFVLLMISTVSATSLNTHNKEVHDVRSIFFVNVEGAGDGKVRFHYGLDLNANPVPSSFYTSRNESVTRIEEVNSTWNYWYSAVPDLFVSYLFKTCSLDYGSIEWFNEDDFNYYIIEQLYMSGNNPNIENGMGLNLFDRVSKYNYFVDCAYDILLNSDYNTLLLNTMSYYSNDKMKTIYHLLTDYDLPPFSVYSAEIDADGNGKYRILNDYYVNYKSIMDNSGVDSIMKTDIFIEEIDFQFQNDLFSGMSSVDEKEYDFIYKQVYKAQDDVNYEQGVIYHYDYYDNNILYGFVLRSLDNIETYEFSGDTASVVLRFKLDPNFYYRHGDELDYEYSFRDIYNTQFGDTLYNTSLRLKRYDDVPDLYLGKDFDDTKKTVCNEWINSMTGVEAYTAPLLDLIGWTAFSKEQQICRAMFNKKSKIMDDMIKKFTNQDYRYQVSNLYEFKTSRLISKLESLKKDDRFDYYTPITLTGFNSSDAGQVSGDVYRYSVAWRINISGINSGEPVIGSIEQVDAGSGGYEDDLIDHDNDPEFDVTQDNLETYLDRFFGVSTKREQKKQIASYERYISMKQKLNIWNILLSIMRVMNYVIQLAYYLVLFLVASNIFIIEPIMYVFVAPVQLVRKVRKL